MTAGPSHSSPRSQKLPGVTAAATKLHQARAWRLPPLGPTAGRLRRSGPGRPRCRQRAAALRRLPLAPDGSEPQSGQRARARLPPFRSLVVPVPGRERVKSPQSGGTWPTGAGARLRSALPFRLLALLRLPSRLSGTAARHGRRICPSVGKSPPSSRQR